MTTQATTIKEFSIDYMEIVGQVQRLLTQEVAGLSLLLEILDAE